jgi:hypothetical protein
MAMATKTERQDRLMRPCDTSRRYSLVISLLLLATALLGACGQATASPGTSSRHPLYPCIQTVEVEVTRVVYRETLVTPTPMSPLTPCSPARLADAGEVVIGALLPLSTAWGVDARRQHADRAEPGAGEAEHDRDCRPALCGWRSTTPATTSCVRNRWRSG